MAAWARQTTQEGAKDKDMDEANSIFFTYLRFRTLHRLRVRLSLSARSALNTRFLPYFYTVKDATMDFERALVSAARISTYYGHSRRIVSLGWSGTGVLASGGGDGVVRLWSWDKNNADGGTPRCELLTGHTQSVDTLAWCPTAPSLLVTGSADRTLRLWDARAGGASAFIVPMRSPPLNIAWAPGGMMVGVGTRDDAFALVDLRGGTGGEGGGGGGPSQA